jgi:hypothetical protein
MPAGDKRIEGLTKIGKKNKTAKQKARQTEEEIASQLGGRVQSNSGAGMRNKGDVKTRDFLIESKETSFDSYRLDLLTLAKISREATEEGRTPALVITLPAGVGTPKRWAVIPFDTFTELVNVDSEEG